MVKHFWIAGSVPLILVLACLVAMVATPQWVHREEARLREEQAHLIEPLHQSVEQIQLGTAQHLTYLRGWVLHRDEVALSEYHRTRHQFQQALQTLASLRGLDPESQSLRTQLLNASAMWLQALDSLPEPASPENYEWQIAILRSRMLRAQMYPASVAERMDEHVEKRRAQYLVEMNRLGEMESLLTRISVILASICASIVFGLGAYLKVVIARLERKRVLLQEAMQMKTRLVHGLTHDLKNPLSVITIYAEMLESILPENTPGGAREAALAIHSSSETMLQRVQGLLDVADQEGSGIAVVRERVSTVQLTRQVVLNHQRMADKKGIHLSVKRLSRNTWAETDPRWVQEILDNLLSNALKYTPSGGSVQIELGSTKRLTLGGHGRWTTITVRDTGNGIEFRDRERIFLHRTRTEAAQRSSAEGHGIGLSISRTLARELGGEITLKSVPGEGSSFTLWLPASPAESEDSSEGESAPRETRTEQEREQAQGKVLA